MDGTRAAVDTQEVWSDAALPNAVRAGPYKVYGKSPGLCPKTPTMLIGCGERIRSAGPSGYIAASGWAVLDEDVRYLSDHVSGAFAFTRQTGASVAGDFDSEFYCDSMWE